MILEPILEEYRIKNNLKNEQLISSNILIQLLQLFGDNDIIIKNILNHTNYQELHSILEKQVNEKKNNLFSAIYDLHPVSRVIHNPQRKYCMFNNKQIKFITKNLLNEYVIQFIDTTFIIVKIIIDKVYDNNNNLIDTPIDIINCIINNADCYEVLRPILRQFFKDKFFYIKNINKNNNQLMVQVIINNEIKTFTFTLENNKLFTENFNITLTNYQLSCLNNY